MSEKSLDCPVCDRKMAGVFSGKLLGKYTVDYFCCGNCGLLATETPYWLDEAYSEAIADTDIGCVARSISNRKRLRPFLHHLFGANARFLDVGGGYGLLCRMMRDIGFECYTYDRYCQNIFARGFELGEGDAKVDALFAFEVLEHLRDPRCFLQEFFDRHETKTIFFSTVTYGDDVPEPDWWYLAPETGQHITFYQTGTLAVLAEQLGCRYYPVTEEFHLLTDRKLSAVDELLLLSKRPARLYRRFVRHKRRKLSLASADYALALQGISEKQ